MVRLGRKGRANEQSVCICMLLNQSGIKSFTSDSCLFFCDCILRQCSCSGKRTGWGQPLQVILHSRKHVQVGRAFQKNILPIRFKYANRCQYLSRVLRTVSTTVDGGVNPSVRLLDFGKKWSDLRKITYSITLLVGEPAGKTYL